MLHFDVRKVGFKLHTAYVKRNGFNNKSISDYLTFLEEFEEKCQQDLVNIEENDIIKEIDAIFNKCINSTRELIKNATTRIGYLDKDREENKITNDAELDLKKNSINIELEKEILNNINDSIRTIKNLSTDGISSKIDSKVVDSVSSLETDRDEHISILEELESEIDNLEQDSRKQKEIAEYVAKYHKVRDSYYEKIENNYNAYEEKKRRLEILNNTIEELPIDAEEKFNRDKLANEKQYLKESIKIGQECELKMIDIDQKLTELDNSNQSMQKFIENVSKKIEKDETKLERFS